jgi:hypothetical protein
MSKAKDERGLQFNVKFDGQPQGKINIAAHVFNNAGNHLESTSIDEAGNFKLALSQIELRTAKIFIAPIGEGKEIPSLKDLEKLNAYQPYINWRNYKDGIRELLPIPELNFKYWWWCKCRVTGRVTKKVFVGGAWQTLPVCRARVHICEVDRWPILIQRFPDEIIYKIRDEIIATKWPVPPIPDPGPRRDFEIERPISRINTLASRAMQSKAVAIKNVTGDFSFAQNNFKAQLASGNSVFQLRRELLENYHLIFPYFCYWKWIWPYFYSCDELAVIETDEQGRFDTVIKYFCFGDKPDIYVWVDYFINGQWVTVYNPGRACNTYWDYVCGTEININITDNRVPHCGRTDVVGEIAEILRIGSSSHTSHILQRSVSQSVQGVSFDAHGLTNFYFGGLTGIKYVNPFGGMLHIVADFGSTLHASGVTHYRCSHKRRSAADTPANWTIHDDSVFRYYEDEINDGVNPPFQHRKGFDLKDPSYAGLYIIPHHEASLQAGIPAPAGTLLNRDWMSEDFVITTINSNELLNELYDFKFEFYRIVAGTPQRVSVPKSTFQVPNPDDTTMSLPLSNSGFVSANYPAFHTVDYIEQDAGIPANALAFKMTFRVDNNLCVAEIDNITVLNSDGTTTDSDTECGFATYKNKNTSEVEFSFAATHPNNFAVFSFGVIRGNGNACPTANTSGMVIGNSSNGYTLAVGKFTKEVPIAGLLGPCAQAAFSENLNVYALATDGSSRLHGYDDGDVAAFALEPLVTPIPSTV